MFVGHLAVALAAKRMAPSISLGTLVLAVVLFDILWTVFLFGGIEDVSFREHPRVSPGSFSPGLDYFRFDFTYSHSLLMGLIWSGVFAAICFWRRKDSRGAFVLCGCVVSHWLLDFISHPPDMLLAPGTDRYFGLGLWDSARATFVVEGSMWFLGIVLYIRATHPARRAGTYAFWIMIVLLTAIFIQTPFAPLPRDISLIQVKRLFEITNLILVTIVLAWAYWINRLRPIKDPDHP